MLSPKQVALQAIYDCILTQGTDYVSEVDLLSVVLDSQRLAQQFFKHCPQWNDVSKEALMPLNLNRKRLSQILALLELSNRIDSGQVPAEWRINRSADVSTIYQTKMSNKLQEHFVALSLNNNNQIISEHLISKGTLNEAPVHCRELFRPLIRDGAASTLLIHNHPSGDPTPSPEDIALCSRLTDVAELMGIPILDFIVVARRGITSFRDTGMM